MNVLSFIIEAKDRGTATIDKIKKQFSELRGDWQKAMAGMKEGSYTGLLNFGIKLLPIVATVGAAFKGLGAAVRWVGEGVEAAAKIETLTIRMSRVTGSMETARAAVRALTEGKHSVKDIFGDDDVLQAATTLEKLSGGALGTAGDIEVLAGAAYDTGQSLSQVAQDIGSLTGMITEGVMGWERYANGLAKAGVLSFETIKQMTDMKNAGKSAGEIVAYMWAQLDQQHAGAIDQARESVEGLRKKAEEAADDMQRAFGELVTPVAKGWYEIKEHGCKAIAAISLAYKDLAEMIGTGLGSLIFGSDTGAVNAMVNEYNKKVAEADGAKTKDLKDKVDSKASKSDDQKAEEKKLQDKRDEAAKKLYDEKTPNRQKLSDLQNDKTNVETILFAKKDLSADDRVKLATELLDIETEILKVKKDIAEEDKREESLMNRDREIREARMTPKQKMEASQIRVKEIQKTLATETDPKKRFELRERIMDEAENQKKLSTGRESMSIGDVFEKMYGQRKTKDLTKEQAATLVRIEKLLDTIAKKPGGMKP